VTVASGGWSLQFTLCSYTTRWDSTGAEQHAVKPRDKLICTDDSRIVLSDSYGSEVRVVCPVPEAELTTVNPTYNWKVLPPILRASLRELRQTPRNAFAPAGAIRGSVIPRYLALGSADYRRSDDWETPVDAQGPIPL